METTPANKLRADCCLWAIKNIVKVYDALSVPFFYLDHRKRVNRRQKKTITCQQIRPNEPTSPWQQVNLAPEHQMLVEHINLYETYDQMLDASFVTNATDICYGYRELLDEQLMTISKQEDSNNKKETNNKTSGSKKSLRRQKLSDYNWVTYAQLSAQIEAAKRAFLLEGVRSGDVVMIFAETRPEWQVAAQALIRIGAIVGTMYSTLNDEGISACLAETCASVVITHVEYIERLLSNRKQLPGVKKIIYFERSTKGIIVSISGNNDESKKRSTLNVQFVQNKDEQSQKSLVNGDSDSNSYDDFATRNTCELVEQAQRTFGVRVGTAAQDEHRQNETESSEHSSAYISQQDGDSHQSNNNNNNNDQHRIITLVSFTQMLTNGRNVSEQNLPHYNRPTSKNQLMVIMYTSGSTGQPKGVRITHANIMSVMESFSYSTRRFVHDAKQNVFASYLPLAHIFEFSIESMMMLHGVRFGFASPHRITDQSPGLMRGVAGDFTLLRPTYLVVVPLILERIVSGIKQAINNEPNYFRRELAQFLIEYKLNWYRQHYSTPLVDRLVCKKVSARALGGRCRYMICGSAPLNAATHEFVSAVLDVECPQGFGATETCAAATCQPFEMLHAPGVGYPLANCLIKLERWEEGNYDPHDKPYARGEIHVSGGFVTDGYYGDRLAQETNDSFYTDAQGNRWYKTGDIGLFMPDGALKIIDRKKDFVKLQNGEFISLGKIESALKQHECFDNFCVHVNAHTNSLVALSSINPVTMIKWTRELLTKVPRDNPNVKQLMLILNMNQSMDSIAKGQPKMNNNATNSHSGSENNSIDKFNQQQDLSANDLHIVCNNSLVVDSLYKSMMAMAREAKLARIEVPKRLLLVAEEWTPESGLVTSAMKIRRHQIYEKYTELIQQAHESTLNK